MDRQEIFNKAWLGLKGQGFETSMKGSSCLYRGPKGRKCAIGHCIDDAQYDESLEGRLAHDDEIRSILRADFTDRVFLRTLQKCHDNADSPQDMGARLLVFAKKYSLTIPSDPAPPQQIARGAPDGPRPQQSLQLDSRPSMADRRAALRLHRNRGEDVVRSLSLTRDIDALQSLPFIERILAYEDFDTALSNWLMARRGRRHHSWDWRLDLRAAQRSWKRYAAAVRKARKWGAAA